MNNHNDLEVIKARCGLGKSYIYTNIISTGKALNDYVICLPTNKAKRHIYKDEFCSKTSIHLPLVTPDLDEVTDKMFSAQSASLRKFRFCNTYGC